MLSPINPLSISFTGYKHPLKTLFKKGRMPSVKCGLYGELIDRYNVSLEHLRAVSHGGETKLNNLALASAEKNSARGNQPLYKYLTWEMLENYLKQFNFRIRGMFDGFKYQEAIRKTCAKLGVGRHEVPKWQQGELNLIFSKPKAKPILEQMEFPFMKDLK